MAADHTAALLANNVSEMVLQVKFSVGDLACSPATQRAKYAPRENIVRLPLFCRGRVDGFADFVVVVQVIGW